jgi:hypothetical protein
MKRVLAFAAAAVALIVATAVVTAAPADPDHDRLIAMCGTWDVDITMWTQPTGPGMTVKGTATIRSLLGGLFVEEKIDAAVNGMAITTLAWTGFNTATRQYEATRISSTNTARIAESGVFDDTSKQFELKADYQMGKDTWRQRTVIQQTSAETMMATSYLSFGAVPEWKGVEIRYRRRSNP